MRARSVAHFIITVAFGRRCIPADRVAPAPKISRCDFLQRDFMAKLLQPSNEVAHDFVGGQAVEMLRPEVPILHPVTQNEVRRGQDTVRDSHGGALLAPATGDALELSGQVTVLLPACGPPGL